MERSALEEKTTSVNVDNETLFSVEMLYKSGSISLVSNEDGKDIIQIWNCKKDSPKIPDDIHITKPEKTVFTPQYFQPSELNNVAIGYSALSAISGNDIVTLWSSAKDK